MAGNLFHLNHNFLTHKCPNLSTKRHLFKHTEIYGPSEMIAYAPQDIFQSLTMDGWFGIYNIRVTQKVTLIYYFIFTLYLFDIFPYVIVYRF